MEERRVNRIDWGIMGLLVLFVLVTYLPGLGSYSLWDPWESQYAQVAHEMVEKDSYIMPWYRGNNQWLSKPVMHLWMMTTSIRLLGESPFSLRLPIVLAAALGVVAVFLGGRLLWTRRAGILAALMTALAPMYFLIGRQTIVDTPYVTFQTLAMVSLMAGLFGRRRHARMVYLFWMFSALALMTKGLLAIMLPGVVLGTYILATGHWSVLRRLRFGKGMMIFLVVGWPWFFYMMLEYGFVSYTRQFFWYHHFRRYAGDIQKPNATFDLYVKYFAYALFPWVAFLPGALASAVRRIKGFAGLRGPDFFLLLCVLMPYLFFSYASTKFHHYVFPCLPFALLLVGVYMDRLLAGLDRPAARAQMFFALLLLGLFAKDIVTDQKAILNQFMYYYDRPIASNMGLWKPYSLLFWGMAVTVAALWLWPVVRSKARSRYVLWGGLVLAAVGLFATGGMKPGVVGTGLRIAAGVSIFAAVTFALPSFFRSSTIARSLLVGLLFGVTTAFMLVVNFQLVKPLTIYFSQEMLYHAYIANATAGEPVCEYHSWERRSVSYYFHNRTTYIPSHKANTKQITRFFKRPGTLYCMVDKTSFDTLKRKVRDQTGRDLKVVDSSHPFTDLVATTEPGEVIQKTASFLLDTPPTPQRPLKAIFGNRIELLGCDQNATRLKRGETLALTCYYRCLKPMEEDYMIFIHGETEEAGGRMIGDHYPADGLFPTNKWQEGQMVKDTWSRVVPTSAQGEMLNLYAGFFVGATRLEVSGPVKAPDNRVLVGQVALTD